MSAGHGAGGAGRTSWPSSVWPHDAATYRAYLERGGNSASMVDEILAAYFPDGATARARPESGPAAEPKRPTTRQTVPSGQLALDFDGVAAAPATEPAAPALFALPGEHRAADLPP